LQPSVEISIIAIMTDMTQAEWYDYGLEKGFIGPAVCQTHDGAPTTLQEDEEYEEGGDPCIFVIRMYEDEEHRKAIEENHSPSVWRRPL